MCRADNPVTIICRFCGNSGILNLLQPLRACPGLWWESYWDVPGTECAQHHPCSCYKFPFIPHRNRDCFIFIAAYKTIQCYLVHGGLISVTACVYFSLPVFISTCLTIHITADERMDFVCTGSFLRFYVETHSVMKGTPLPNSPPRHRLTSDGNLKGEGRCMNGWNELQTNLRTYLQIVGGTANRPNFFSTACAFSVCPWRALLRLCSLTFPLEAGNVLTLAKLFVDGPTDHLLSF